MFRYPSNYCHVPLAFLSKIWNTGCAHWLLFLSQEAFSYLITGSIPQKHITVKPPVRVGVNKEMSFCGLEFLHFLVHSPALY